MPIFLDAIERLSTRICNIYILLPRAAYPSHLRIISCLSLLINHLWSSIYSSSMTNVVIINTLNCNVLYFLQQPALFISTLALPPLLLSLYL